MKASTVSPAFTVESQAPIFAFNGKEYYLVHFKAVAGITSSTHREPKEALDAAGHIPAVIRGKEVLDILGRFFKRGDGWITLYDCRENMNNRVAYFNAIGLSHDGLCFYHMEHVGGPSEHPALCWKDAQ